MDLTVFCAQELGYLFSRWNVPIPLIIEQTTPRSAVVVSIEVGCKHCHNSLPLPPPLSLFFLIRFLSFIYYLFFSGSTLPMLRITLAAANHASPAWPGAAE